MWCVLGCWQLPISYCRVSLEPWFGLWYVCSEKLLKKKNFETQKKRAPFSASKGNRTKLRDRYGSLPGTISHTETRYGRLPMPQNCPHGVNRSNQNNEGNIRSNQGYTSKRPAFGPWRHIPRTRPIGPEKCPCPPQRALIPPRGISRPANGVSPVRRANEKGRTRARPNRPYRKLPDC